MKLSNYSIARIFYKHIDLNSPTMIKIKASSRNTNKHTEKGMELIDKSVSEVGVLESISVTEQGTIISGHARKKIFDKQGKVPKEIRLNDNEYPVIITNIQDDTALYYQAQILANTTSKENLNLDYELIEELIEEYEFDVEDLGIVFENQDADIDFDGLSGNQDRTNAKQNKQVTCPNCGADFEC